MFKAPLSWKKEEGMGISIIYLAKGGRNGLFQAPFSLAKGGKWVVPLFTVPGQRRKERVVPLFSWQKKEGRGVVPGSPFPGKGMKEWVIPLVTWQKEEGMGYSRRPSPWQRPGGMGYSIIYLAKGGRMGCSIIYLAKGERKRGCSRLPFPWQRHEGMGYSIFTWQKEEGMGCSRRPSPWQRPGGMGCSCPSSRPACGNLADPAEVHRPSLLLHHPTQGKWIVPVPSSVGRFLNPDLLTCELD